MKNYILPLMVFSFYLLYPNITTTNCVYNIPNTIEDQNPRDRQLSPEEVKQRGIDLMVNQVVVNIDELDLRKMARSAIFETSYGFRWKMVNLHTGQKIIIKVNKDFKVLSVRDNRNTKIM